MKSANLTADQYEMLFGERPPEAEQGHDQTQDDITVAAESAPDVSPSAESGETTLTEQKPTQDVVVHPEFADIDVSGRRGPNHYLHAVLSLMTIGLWLPVWAIVAMRTKLKSS